MAQTPGPLGGEFRIVLADGEVKWLLRRSTVVSSDAAGQLRVGVLLDVTDRKRAQEALSESEALWRLALESAGDGVGLESGDRRRVRVDRIKTMFGFGDEDLDGTFKGWMAAPTQTTWPRWTATVGTTLKNAHRCTAMSTGCSARTAHGSGFCRGVW
ncbi:MAG: PAS domain-containing protein [Burkholderiaceae bacterium]